MEVFIIGLLLAVSISVVEFFSKKLNLRHKRYYYQVVSLSAGVSSSYMLLDLFPLFAEGAFQYGKFLFLFLLLGFIAHHVIEKEIYKHNRLNELVRMLSLEQQVFYYVYHVILGIVLMALMSQGVVEGVFFGVSILAYTLVSNLPTDPHPSLRRMVFLSSSTLVGALVGLFIANVIPGFVRFALIGLVAGVLMFTITRHHIPHGRVGRVGFFVLGFLVYAMLIVSKWIL